MEDLRAELEFQPLSLGQKEEIIRKKLAEFGTNPSDKDLQELTVRLLHPETLTWEGAHKRSRLPPQQGLILNISPDIAWGRRNKVKFVRVDLTGTAPVTGISYAQFSLGAVEMTKVGELVIDCAQLETPEKTGEITLQQNTFVEKVAT